MTLVREDLTPSKKSSKSTILKFGTWPKEPFGERTDSHVMDCYSKEGLHTTWSFLDITGTLKHGESSYDSLWEAVNNSLDPTKPNIDGLMGSEEDDRLIRMY